MQRRTFIAGALALPFVAPIAHAADLPRVAVAKSPTCGCCGAWVEHMRAAGFRIHEARAALLPRLTLTGTAGNSGTALNQIDDSAKMMMATVVNRPTRTSSRRLIPGASVQRGRR